MHACTDKKHKIAGKFKIVCLNLLLCVAAVALTSAVITVVSAGKVNLLGVSIEVVTGGSMSPSINTGDMVVVADSPTDNYNVGDIVTYEFSEDGRLVTHRLVSESASGTFTIKGDANSSVDRHEISASQIIGKVVAIIPTSDPTQAFTLLGAVILATMFLGHLFKLKRVA